MNEPNTSASAADAPVSPPRPLPVVQVNNKYTNHLSINFALHFP
jgi:hypothetical protein